MKVTLKTAPEGYEAEAEWRLPKQGEPIVRASGAVRFAAFDYNDHNHDFQIVLTPKKPKQWLLTEVATFEEATGFNRCDSVRLGIKGCNSPQYHSLGDGILWLKLTEVP